ncbi:hypothetical protein [Pseudophaeobacter flagellatus]|uniref:hypothetical protein n=1 Tax=Pseudophaeobacter flagellatus TaxID=2899119 RepID=UPI001E45051E|nr:hypothetical protein [Pseudophaeobacter flagellatus]MCD9148529.1 hypothetical protein [Pseudophaeobacter flagellatus]
MIRAVILRNLPGIALVAVLAGGVWSVADAFQDRARLRADLAATRSDLTRAQATLQQAAETARIHRAHLDRAADEARQWSALSNDLQQMEGRDAPLSPLLAATAQRLFSTSQ